jgi:hypothetical protein
MPFIHGYADFELNLMRAILDQMVPLFGEIRPAPLNRNAVNRLPNQQGVYQLIHNGDVKYIGKTDAGSGLRSRLSRHIKKFEHRDRISPEEVSFRAMRVLVFTAVDVETQLRECFRPEWNNSGFGSNDPGRERETTNKPEQGFDAQYPIDIDIDLDLDSLGILEGCTSVHELLWKLKEALPYTFRYETNHPGSPQPYRQFPHQDYLDARMCIKERQVTARELLRRIVEALPSGWQATKFVSHVILYKEHRVYQFGNVIA